MDDAVDGRFDLRDEAAVDVSYPTNHLVLFDDVAVVDQRSEHACLGGRNAAPLHVKVVLLLWLDWVPVQHAEVLQQVHGTPHVVHHKLLNGLGPVAEARLAYDTGHAVGAQGVYHGAGTGVSYLWRPRQHIFQPKCLGHGLSGIVYLLPDPELDGVHEVALR